VIKGDNIEALISDFIYRYGERGRAVLEAIVRASQKLAKDAVTPLPGDFDYRSVVEELGIMGYSYNPSPLLRILEKEYGLIKTTLIQAGRGGMFYPIERPSKSMWRSLETVVKMIQRRLL